MACSIAASPLPMVQAVADEQDTQRASVAAFRGRLDARKHERVVPRDAEQQHSQHAAAD